MKTKKDWRCFRRARLLLLEIGNVRPAETAAGQQHVPDEGLDGGLPHQAHEKQLLDDGGGDGAQGRQAQQQLPEPVGLVGVLAPHVLLQRALGLLLEALHVRHVRQTAGIYTGGGSRTQQNQNKHAVQGL